MNFHTPIHVDQNDWQHGFCCIINVGNAKGCKLLLPDINLEVSVPPGSITFLRSALLKHGVSSWSGDSRYAIVLFARKEFMLENVEDIKL
jgi:hypothetical protein